jgi:hypothetical protein
MTITNTIVSDYQKAGMFASGSVTMNVSANSIGTPSSVPFSIAQNGVQWTNTSTNSDPAVGASGTSTTSDIIGSSFGSAAAADIALLLFGADNVTIDENTISGVAIDFGIAVAQSTNVVISFNAIGRTPPAEPDPYGTGVEVDEASAATTMLI